MNCSQVREAFLKGERLPEVELRAHLDGCKHCRELFEGNAELGRSLAQVATPVAALDDWFGALEARIEREQGLRAWLRSRPSSLRFRLATLAALLVLVLGGALRQRSDFASYPTNRLLLLVGGYLALALFALRSELALVQLPRSVRDRPWLLLGPLALPFLLAFSPATEASRHAGPAGALNCFVYGMLLTVPVGLLLWALGRDERPSLRMVCLSALTLGILANAVLELHCPSGNALHLLLGHASIGVAWCAAWWLTRKLSATPR